MQRIFSALLLLFLRAVYDIRGKKIFISIYILYAMNKGKERSQCVGNMSNTWITKALYVIVIGIAWNNTLLCAPLLWYEQTYIDTHFRRFVLQRQIKAAEKQTIHKQYSSIGRCNMSEIKHHHKTKSFFILTCIRSELP